MNLEPQRQRPAGKAMPAPDQQAREHACVRQAHETELVEDYVELIADLIDTRGQARAVDLARRLGVAQATVAKMLGRLSDRGLVVRERYRAIFLTDAGRAVAAQSRRRHTIVLDFLRVLGVDDATARRDAEGVEHHLSEESLRAMDRFVREYG